MLKFKNLVPIVCIPLLISLAFFPSVSHAEEKKAPTINADYKTTEIGEFPNESLSRRLWVNGDYEGWKFYYKVTNQMADQPVRAGGLECNNYLDVKGLKYGDEVDVWGEKGKEITRKENFRILPDQEVLNGSFETGISTPWKTTALNRKVYISSSPQDFNLTSVKDGKKFACVNDSASLYQEMEGRYNQKYKWSLSYAGSSDEDTIAIIVGPTCWRNSAYREENSETDIFQNIVEYLKSEYGTLELNKDYDVLYGEYSIVPYRVRLVKANGRKWIQYSGTYTNSDRTNNLVIACTSLNSKVKNGNLIDDVKVEPVDESQKKEPTHAMTDYTVDYRQVNVSEIGKKGVSYKLPELPEGAHYGTPMIRYNTKWFVPRMSNYKIENNILTFDVSKAQPLWVNLFYISVLDSKHHFTTL